MVVLGLVGRVKVVLAAKVGEGAFLPELDRLALDGNGQGCGCRLFRVDFMVGEFVCPKLACGQVEFKYLGECCDQVGLLL